MLQKILLEVVFYFDNSSSTWIRQLICFGQERSEAEAEDKRAFSPVSTAVSPESTEEQQVSDG